MPTIVLLMVCSIKILIMALALARELRLTASARGANGIAKIDLLAHHAVPNDCVVRVARDVQDFGLRLQFREFRYESTSP